MGVKILKYLPAAASRIWRHQQKYSSVGYRYGANIVWIRYQT